MQTKQKTPINQIVLNDDIYWMLLRLQASGSLHYEHETPTAPLIDLLIKEGVADVSDQTVTITERGRKVLEKRDAVDLLLKTIQGAKPKKKKQEQCGEEAEVETIQVDDCFECNFCTISGTGDEAYCDDCPDNESRFIGYIADGFNIPSFCKRRGTSAIIKWN